MSSGKAHPPSYCVGTKPVGFRQSWESSRSATGSLCNKKDSLGNVLILSWGHKSLPSEWLARTLGSVVVAMGWMIGGMLMTVKMHWCSSAKVYSVLRLEALFHGLRPAECMRETYQVSGLISDSVELIVDDYAVFPVRLQICSAADRLIIVP